MSDHEFEKQVQQRLDEFKVRPSDTVWMEVEKNIRHQKRRRRFIWLWLPLLFVCLSTSGYILYRQVYQSGQTRDIAKAVISAKSNTPAIETNNTHRTNSSNTIQNSQTVTAEPVKENQLQQPVQQNTGAGTQPTTDNNHSVVTPSPVDEKPLDKAEAPVAGLPDKEYSAATVTNTAKHRTYKPNKIVKKKTVVTRGNNRPHWVKRSKQNKAVDKKSIISEKRVQQETIVQNELQPVSDELTYAMPSLVKEDNDIATNRAVTDSLNKKMIRLAMVDSLSHTTTSVARVQRKRSGSWHWGVEANAGLSRIASNSLFQLKGLLGEEKYLAEDLAARSYNTTNANSVSAGNNSLLTTSPSVKKASPIQPDLAFSTGVFAEKMVSRRFRLSVGLRYAYLSVNTIVGQKVNDTALVNLGKSSAILVPEYYKGAEAANANNPSLAGYQNYAAAPVDQRYRYRYQYIEIPVLAHWQINKGRRLPPIVFDGGFSVSRLMSVDALHYEGVKGIYYKKDSLFNKTQLSFSTGLSVGLWQRSKHPLWIGPNLRYGLTGLVKKEVSTGQYLWSAGITARILMGRL